VNQIRCGIIGAGFAGATHAEALRYAPAARLVAIASPGPANRTALAERYGVEALAAPEELIARPDVDAIIIASPHAVHAKQAIAAARAGKHVLVEKPMATSVADCQAMITACAEAGVRLMVGHFQRFRDPAVAAKLIFDSGQMGRVLMLRDVMAEPAEGAWRDRPESVGVLLGYGVHAIDRIRWWLGSEVVQVSALSNRFQGRPVEDGTQMLMHFANGAEASLMCTDIWPVRDDRSPGAVPASCLVIGERGALDVDMYGDVRLSLGGPWRTVATLPRWDSPVAFERIRAYALQMREFIAAIVSGREPGITGRDGMAAVRVALAAYESAAQGRWVHIEP